MRKGGSARDIRKLAVWLFIITMAMLLLAKSVGRVKQNYTELHRRVTELELK